MAQSVLKSISNHVRWLINISQSMRLIDDHQVPGRVGNVGSLVTGKLIRTNYNRIFNLKGSEVTKPGHLVIVSRFEDRTRKKKLFRQLLQPLLSQIRGSNNQDSFLALSPTLRNHKPGFDCLAESNFIGQQGALR